MLISSASSSTRHAQLSQGAEASPNFFISKVQKIPVDPARKPVLSCALCSVNKCYQEVFRTTCHLPPMLCRGRVFL
ncbi:hypothetical protein AB205_0064000 [Aquarana catesbeiana]|uniref:Uncharacterized protein n=1 Tax=Aquarana catesbeiana TaxID=8400 RepID=A0A2G9RU56_AQUCT|nr:hypothetical protein AB205_0064000 [Aquarana catesbeiana]